MGRRIEIDGKFFRIRRGKMVEIPSGWIGRVTTSQTKRKRQSKLTGKLSRTTKFKQFRPGYPYIDRRYDMVDDEA